MTRNFFTLVALIFLVLFLYARNIIAQAPTQIIITVAIFAGSAVIVLLDKKKGPVK